VGLCLRAEIRDYLGNDRVQPRNTPCGSGEVQIEISDQLGFNIADIREARSEDTDVTLEGLEQHGAVRRARLREALDAYSPERIAEE
jgi:hypothetical protein